MIYLRVDPFNRIFEGRVMRISFKNSGTILLTFVAVASIAAATCSGAEEALRWKFKVGEKLNYNIVQEMKMSFPQFSTTMHQ